MNWCSSYSQNTTVSFECIGIWPKINILKGNHCILRIREAPVHQKLGMILENSVSKIEVTHNFFSVGLILASTNPQYYKRLLMELP